MIEEPFASGNSWVHRVDPRQKIVLAVAFSLVVALASRLQVLSGALVFSVLLAVAARLQYRAVMKRLWAAALFLVLIWVSLPLTHPGPPLFQTGPMVWTRTGFGLAAQITLKSASILLAFMALMATMSVATLGQALGQLHAPAKLVQLLLLTYRYIFVLEAEYRRLFRAAKIRGFRSATSLHAYRTYANLLGMLFVRASVRAQRVGQAMRCRGFGGRFYSLQEYRPYGGNLWFGLTGALVVVLLAALEWWMGPL